MKKKILLISILVAIITLIIILIFSLKNSEVIEYIPEEEISEKDYILANVILYFQNKESKVIEAESREVKNSELIENPYKAILEMLIDGPKNEKLEKLIPEGTKINKVTLDKYCLNIDFSREFIDNCGNDKNKQENVINSISKTMLELTEVSEIKILIDGIEGLGFPNGDITF